MTAAAPIEDLLLQVLDRLTRQERRSETIEAALLRLTTSPGAARALNGSHSPPPSSSSETPPEIPWPRRESRASTKTADRVKELEQRLLEAEERLRIAARLEIVGRLVTGVAHDFNNLLTIISGHADVIRAELPGGHPLRDTADLISTTAHTAAGVTRQLVSFGKPGRPEPCPVDANTAVRTIEQTLGRLTGGRVSLTVTLAANVPLIQIDPGQFDQVLINLVVNARDAIPDTGTITVRTAAATILPGRTGWPADIGMGEFVVVTVTDTGIGMTEDVKARIFDIFFTTKGNRGNGIGLSTVKDIVKSNGGHIEIESAPDWGTSVRVYWPAYPEPIQDLRLTW
jgi:two-component system cell cycle sensor histidine kinase/response regulator CckA